VTKSKTSGETGEHRPERGTAGSHAAADRDGTLSASGSAVSVTGEDGPVAAIVDDPDVLARGSAVGRYVVLEKLGAGAMGVVYAAFDPELDRRIALKILRPQDDATDRVRRQARLVREAKAIAKVSHSNVVAIHDVGVHDGQVFMAMEHLAGGTLRDWMEAEKRPWREVVRMFRAIGEGLAGAHVEGLVHRDFKPDNVLLDKNGVPKVVDFGLVRLSAAVTELTSSDVFAETVDARAPAQAPPVAPAGPAALTRTGALTGTPAYMAPEQFRAAAVDARTDQFAFCVTLYEALYGERPFPRTNIIALADSVTSGRIKDAPKDSQVPAWVRRAVLRGLSVDPERRFSSFDELNAVLANDPAKRTRRWAIGGASVMAAVAAVGVAHRLGSHRPTCKADSTRLAGIWEPGPAGDARKVAIHHAFAATGKSYAEQAFAGASRLLDQYVGRWTGMYTEACEATNVRGEQSAEVLDLRMACLTERLDNARALTDVFTSADGKVVQNAVSAAAALPPLDGCADVPLLRAVVKPPEDARTRKRVDDLRGELANLIALRDSGQCARALPKADQLIADVRAVGYQPLLAETLYESGHLGDFCSDGEQMVQRFKEAYAAATASRKDDVAALAAAVIPTFAINRLNQVSVARDWFGVAEGAVSRLGRETMASALLAESESIVLSTGHEYPRALKAADRSIDITRRLLGPDAPMTITLMADKGNLLETAGRLEEALRNDIAARERFDRVLGSEHPLTAMSWCNQGELLNLLGRPDQAEAAYDHCLQIYRQSGTDRAVVGWALTGLGRARLGENRTAAALAPLEQALAVRIDTHASDALLGETRFALARALWARPEDRRRAVALARAARTDLADNKTAVAEIDVWLSKARATGTR
jgi:tRNA A-37 threonylcarbamoyl transferase component Bud32/tetratricopeptide (TPR) repeat protein